MNAPSNHTAVPVGTVPMQGGTGQDESTRFADNKLTRSRGMAESLPSGQTFGPHAVGRAGTEDPRP